MRLVLTFLLILPLLFQTALAQDERRVVSPNGQIEFRLSIVQPPDRGLSRLSYQVFFRGKRLLDTSYLGLVIRDQEPVLGENVGLIASKLSNDAARYHGLIAEYMQNGSIGRRLNLEVRVWDDGVAFRYVIPRTTPLQEILIDSEMTEFSFAQNGNGRANATERDVRLSSISRDVRIALPFLVDQPGVAKVAIAES